MDGAVAGSPVFVEKGADPRVLVIAFTGFKGGLMMPAFDFFDTTKLTRYSRVLLRDTARTCYLGGVPPKLPDFGALLGFLRNAVAELAPEKLLCLGASSGAFGALLLGHALKADYVHAFSPFTYVGRAQAQELADADGMDRHGDAISRIEALPDNVKPLFDLQAVLARRNGKTRFYIHVCKNSPWDIKRAKRLEQTPGATIIAYPCASHGVAVALARAGLLEDLLKIENQDRIEDLIRERNASGA